MTDTPKSITDMMKIHGVDEDERQKLLSSIKKQVEDQKKTKFFDVTAFHAKDDLTKKLNEQIIIKKAVRDLENEDKRKRQALLDKQYRQKQQLLTKKRKKSHTLGAIAILFTVTGIWFAYQATQILYTAYESSAPLNENLLQHAFNNSATGLIFTTIAVIIFFGVANLSNQVSAWWLNFICFAITATQTVLIGYNLLITKNIIDNIFN